MIQKFWNKYCLGILSWTYDNSFLTVMIVAAVFLISLVLFGCQSMPEINPQPPKVGEQAIIQIYNSTGVFYTVTINSGDFSDYYVLESGESTYVKLAKRPYKVCISREFDVEETCVDKIVNGDDIWKIHAKNQ